MRVNGYCISPGYCQEILNWDRAGLGDGNGFTSSKARRNQVLKKFRHRSCTLEQWLSKVQTYRMLNTAASSCFFSFQRTWYELSWKVHVKLFLPKGRIGQNTRSELTCMTSTCMHTNKYNGGFQKRWGRKEFAGFQISAFWLEYSSILTGLCYCDLLTPTIFLRDEQICCYICVYNFSPSLVVAPGLWINYKPQTLWFQFPTMPPHILFFSHHCLCLFYLTILCTSVSDEVWPPLGSMTTPNTTFIIHVEIHAKFRLYYLYCFF